MPGEAFTVSSISDDEIAHSLLLSNPLNSTENSNEDSIGLISTDSWGERRDNLGLLNAFAQTQVVEDGFTAIDADSNPAGYESSMAMVQFRVSDRFINSSTNPRQGREVILAHDSFGYDQVFYNPPRAFSARKSHTRHASLNRSFILCTLRSFPSMILPDSSLPPFIHNYYSPRVASSGKKFTALNCGQRSLEACALIVRWKYTMKDKENTKNLWGTIRVEIERLLTEVRFSTFGLT